MILALAALPLAAVRGGAGDLSTFAQFYNPDPATFDSCEFKFTYLGTQQKSKPSLAGATYFLNPFLLDSFVPFERTQGYADDNFTGDTLVTSPGEIHAFANGLSLYASMQDTLTRTDPLFSVMMLRYSGSQVLCWEHQVTSAAQGDSIFQLLHDAILDPASQLVVDRYRHHFVGVRR